VNDRDTDVRVGAAPGTTESKGTDTPREERGDSGATRDERARRADDIIRRKQEDRARTAIQTELAEEDAARRARPEDPGPLEGAVIEMERVSLAFDRPILEDVSFAAFPGETLVIVGESGTGKSTALKLILRLLQPDEGRVYVYGKDIADLSFTEALAVRQKMGMVFQSAALFDSMTVFENTRTSAKMKSRRGCARSWSSSTSIPRT
jgi:ABC-type multidrug transport system fused ATPase/permease subunit